jgi:hypothetical protein
MTAGVAFIAAELRLPASRRLRGALSGLAEDGWLLDPQQIAGRVESGAPAIYWSEPFQDVAAFGLFQAPDLPDAHRGITTLMLAGWGRTFERTQWIVGPRDIPPSLGAGPFPRGLGFLALWDWNDRWHEASPEERAAYDADCDVAFAYDVELGIDIFGRFDVGGTSDWDHVALWDAPDLATLTEAMHGHQIQDDFMFTTSHHLIGRPIALDRLEERLL